MIRQRVILISIHIRKLQHGLQVLKRIGNADYKVEEEVYRERAIARIMELKAELKELTGSSTAVFERWGV